MSTIKITGNVRGKDRMMRTRAIGIFNAGKSDDGNLESFKNRNIQSLFRMETQISEARKDTGMAHSSST